MIKEGAVLAPMAGITNPPFRKLCMKMGAVMTVTELVSSHALVYLASKERNKKTSIGKKTLSIIEPFEGETPFTVQIFGRDPAMMAEAAGFAESKGANIIDINFGCPAKKVVKGGEGAGVALMREPEKLEKIAVSVVNAVSIPVTAKIRTGWSDVERNAPLIAKLLENVGIKAVCVHARTRDQVHSGLVDLNTLAEVVKTVSIPVIGNGGIKTKDDADKMLSITGCSRVAIGQGAKGNPWIFTEIRTGKINPNLKERIETCKHHLALYSAWVGEQRAVVEMRKHACWYVKGFEGAAAFRNKLAFADSSESFIALLNSIGEN